ncbi:MAG: hypothetical protein GXO75_04750, partial [Calditrichaeota bacterium]|nr:hypothetical protein [Calditrichota bacterium]
MLLKKIILVTCLLFLSCLGKDKNHNEQVLARIGNQTITAGDFKLNYEFGFGNLKRGNDRKRSYLNAMIKEKLLSLEGYRLGFDKSQNVRLKEAQLLDELLVEALFEKKVKSKINVTAKEIQDAINKSKVSFKLRYWIEPDLLNAKVTVTAMRARGYADVVGQKLHANPEIKLNMKNLETDYLTYFEIAPEIFDQIKNLPIGEISNPLELNGYYAIFQIADIRRSGVFDSEYKTKMPKFKKILFHRKLLAAAVKYVDHFMTSKKVVMKGEAFGLLGKAFTEWKKSKGDSVKSFQEAVKQADDSAPAMKALRENGEMVFMTFSGGNWTINEFFKKFNPNRVSSIDKNPNGLPGALKDAAALTIRDYFLVKKAERQHLEKSPKLQKELQQWRDKWVYEETRTYFTKNLNVTDEEAKAYFKTHKKRYIINLNHEPTFGEFAGMAKRDTLIEKKLKLLTDKIEKLQVRYSVQINKTVVDTLQVIDFKKSRWVTVQLFNLGS